MHKLCLWIAGERHQFTIDLIGQHLLNAFAPQLRRLAHRHPNIGVQEIAALHRRFNLISNGQASAGLAGDDLRRLDAFGIGPALALFVVQSRDTQCHRTDAPGNAPYPSYSLYTRCASRSDQYRSRPPPADEPPPRTQSGYASNLSQKSVLSASLSGAAPRSL